MNRIIYSSEKLHINDDMNGGEPNLKDNQQNGLDEKEAESTMAGGAPMDMGGDANEEIHRPSLVVLYTNVLWLMKSISQFFLFGKPKS